MDVESERAILQAVEATWHALRSGPSASAHTDGPWPYGAWIRLHDPLPDDAEEATTPLRKAWFLDADGLREMNPWAYARFWEMQLRQSWAVSESPPRNPIFTRERHYIATVAFAEFAGADELYLSMIWGGLRGGAERIAVRDGQVVHFRALWIA